jgi:dipeptidyl aminopeptidase/acylaminoacyl peptidase
MTTHSRTFPKHLVSVPILALAVACGPADEAADSQEFSRSDVPEYTIEQFMETTNVFGSSFSPDGSKILVSTDETGIMNAYAIPVAGGDPIPLTSSTSESIRVSSYFPDDERFIYMADIGGNELDHVYVRELDGAVTDLTPGEGLKAWFGGWAKDDQTFFIGSNERDNRFFDIYEVTVDGYEKTLIYQDETGYGFGGISPDERYIVFSKPNTTSDSDIYLYDREAEEMRHLTPHEGEVSNSPQDFSPDGSSLYITTDDGTEFAYLAKIDLATGEREVVFQPDWDVWYGYFSEEGKYMVAGVNEDARTRIHMYEMPDMREVELPAMEGLDITSVNLSDDESAMAFYASSARSPRNLFVHDIGGEEPQRLTESLTPEIQTTNLVDAEVVRFTSYDGVEIPGVLYKPHEASADNQVPALVWVHGGPGGQSRVGYSALIQYLVNHGYAVYAINNRGSSGYGKTFYKMDDRKHGDADLDDCVASKQMLIDTGWIDPERIGILGGSYGGYMVLAALTFRPEEFAVGVDLFGISNWHRTVTNIPPWWESFRDALEQEMGDFDDEEFFKAKSPLFHADQIVRPLMVLQGANDPRVLQVESDEIVEAVRANGVPVEYVLFEDEGHGFRKKENQLEGWRKVREFLDQYLRELPAPEPAVAEEEASRD